MNQAAMYETRVTWLGEHLGHITMGNGPEMDFSAPPDTKGISGVLTPEDAFVAAVNTCIMMMFLWACERLKIKLLAYECRAEGKKLIGLDHTESFTQVRLFPKIRAQANGEDRSRIENRIDRALKSAQKYSLVANSIKADMIIEPEIEIVH